MESIRVHGKGGHKYDNVRIGINGRLDTLQATILLPNSTSSPKKLNLETKSPSVIPSYYPLSTIHYPLF